VQRLGEQELRDPAEDYYSSVCILLALRPIGAAHPSPPPVKFFGVGDPPLRPAHAPVKLYRARALLCAPTHPSVKLYRAPWGASNPVCQALSASLHPCPVRVSCFSLPPSLSEKLDKGRAGVGCPIRPQGLTPRASACADPLPRQHICSTSTSAEPPHLLNLHIC